MRKFWDTLSSLLEPHSLEIERLDAAIERGNDHAMVNRAYMHVNGQGGPVNMSEAIRLYDMAIAKGNSRAMINRAYMHFHGEGGPVDYPEAIRLYEMAIRKGSPYAMAGRAYMHFQGLGGPVDISAATHLCRQAIQANPAMNQRILELMPKLHEATMASNRAERPAVGLTFSSPISYDKGFPLLESHDIARHITLKHAHNRHTEKLALFLSSFESPEVSCEEFLQFTVIQDFLEEETRVFEEKLKQLQESLYLAEEQCPKEAPSYLTCPITQDVMRYPVVIETGISYDIEAILAWFNENETCPVTNQRLYDKSNIIPNFCIKPLCDAYWDPIDKHQSLFEDIQKLITHSEEQKAVLLKLLENHYHQLQIKDKEKSKLKM